MELLPSAAYYSAYSAISPSYTTVQSVTAETLAGLSPPATPQGMTLVDAAEQMHQSDDIWAPLDPSVGLLRMIGYDAYDASPNCGSPCSPPIYVTGPSGDTIVNAFNPDGSLASSPVKKDGDGTVPLFSANLYNPANGFDDRGTGRDMYWCGLSHMGLAQDTAVWQSAEAFLEGRVSYATDVVGAACPDGGLGTIANLNLVGAQPAQPANAVGLSGPASDMGCSPATTRTTPIRTSITVDNNSTTDSIDLYWHDPSCQEVLYATIPPQMHLTQTAYVGDVWHIRLHSGGALIGTATATAHPQTIVAPLPIDIDTQGIRAAEGSVSRVVAYGCGGPGGATAGSAWPVGSDLLLTTAQVVAGSQRVEVDTPGGGVYPAQVVLFDPNLHVAILNVPGLGVPALPMASGNPPAGTQGAVIGYPGGGPEAETGAMVRGTDGAQVENVAADIPLGDAGGPLVNLRGQVVGVVYATSMANPGTGYALGVSEVTADVQAAQSQPSPVTDGSCTG
jgi:hypothetical protein